MFRRRNYNFSYRNPKIAVRTPRIRTGWSLPPLRWGCLLWLLAVVVVTWFLIFSDFFKISQIYIHGHISDRLQQEFSGLQNKNILMFAPGWYSRKLQVRMPAVKEIRIERGLPDTLRIYVSERQQELVWRSGDKFYLLDNSGVAFAEAAAPSAEESQLKVVVADLRSAEVQLGSQIVSAQFINFVKRLLEELPSQTGLKITEVQVEETTFNPQFLTIEGFKIFFDINLPLKAQLSAIKQVLDNNRDLVKEYIDVRVLGRVFVK